MSGVIVKTDFILVNTMLVFTRINASIVFTRLNIMGDIRNCLQKQKHTCMALMCQLFTTRHNVAGNCRTFVSRDLY